MEIPLKTLDSIQEYVRIKRNNYDKHEEPQISNF